MRECIPADYPRPQFYRPSWMLLDGAWEFELDLSNSGEERGLAKAEHLQSTICVPFCPESRLSGVGFTGIGVRSLCRMTGRGSVSFCTSVPFITAAASGSTERKPARMRADTHRLRWILRTISEREKTAWCFRLCQTYAAPCSPRASSRRAMEASAASIPVPPAYGRACGWSVLRTNT